MSLMLQGEISRAEASIALLAVNIAKIIGRLSHILVKAFLRATKSLPLLERTVEALMLPR
jgi:hypothetical protein